MRKTRILPCTECRKQRRKCTRPDFMKSCTRCERLGRVCQQVSKSNSEQDTEDNDITNLQNQVGQLEGVIAHLELQLRNLRIRSNQSSPSSSNMEMAGLTNPMIHHLLSNWKIKIKNGGFQIETGIKSIAELLQTSPNVSYLSPLSPSSSLSSFDSYSYSSFGSNYLGESNLILRFSEGTHSLSRLTIKLVKKALLPKDSEPAPTLIVPTVLLLDTKKLVDEIIDVFFTCHNIASPLVHENTFRKKYEKLRDPLNDLITLSICSYVCSNPCEHITYSAWEGRSMSDFFYAKAKSILFDQFDDVEKRFENVSSVNLLARYLHVTLKFAECRQLIMIARDLCYDLRKDYLDDQPPPDSFCFNYKLHLRDYVAANVFCEQHVHHKSTANNVNKVLYARHVTFSIFVSRLLEYITFNGPDERCLHFPYWDYLDDEPEITKKTVKSFNWVLQLFYHPFVAKFMEQVRMIHLGKECSLSFESIVKIEEVISEWALSTPAEFRLCTNFNKLELSKKSIDEATDPTQIMNFIEFHSHYLNIYSCLLQPSPIQETASQELLSYVRQHSLEQASKSCQLVLYAVHHLSINPNLSSCHYLLQASDFLFDTMDILVLMAVSSDVHIAKEAKEMIKKCTKEIDGIRLMQDHHVPKHASPLTKNGFPSAENFVSDLEYYDQYPRPWFALMYDISHSLST